VASAKPVVLIRILAASALAVFTSTYAAAEELTEVTCDPHIDSNGDFRCQFDIAMNMDKNTHVWVANFTLPGEGAFSALVYDLFRGKEKVFDMSTYGVTFVREPAAKRVRLKVDVWDKRDWDGKLEHRIKGKLLLRPDPKS